MTTSQGDVAAHRAVGSPVRGLTVLYDVSCPICRALSRWLAGQRQLVPLDFVPAGSREAWERFPGLDVAATLEEITVIGDGGQVYTGDAAWIACLWALARHRRKAYRLATPAGRPLARATVLIAAKLRSALNDRGTDPGLCGDGTCRAGPAPDERGISSEGRRHDGSAEWVRHRF